MYNFFLDGVQFPVAPSEMTMRINNKNETVTLMNDGEVNILKKPGLTDVSFEVEFPNVRYPYAVYPNGFQPASFFLDHLESLKVSEKPSPFIVNRMMPNGKLLFDTNMIMSVEDYDILEDAENGFDITVQINLKQFRSYGTKRLSISPTVASTSNTTTKKASVVKNRPTTGKVTPKTHKVQPNETLWAIAKRYLGDGAKADYLAKLNNIKSPNLIKAGQVIKLG